MFRYLIRRILWAAVLLVAVTFVSFVIFFIVPASPARLMTGPQAPPDQVERVEKMLGLDDPVPVQYARFSRTNGCEIHRWDGVRFLFPVRI